MFPVIPTAELFIRLAALIVAEYPVADPPLLRLYKNNVTPDENMTLDTFEEADFAGYAAEELVMEAPTMNDQGLVVTRSNLCSFTSAAGVDPQTIYGIYIVDAAVDKVIAAQKFAAPQQMGGVYAQAISGVWRSSEPTSGYGWIDVEA